MGSPAIGAVVLVNFPFANLKGYKIRPAVVVANSSLDTVILCQITSRKLTDVPGIAITKKSFKNGDLPMTSYVRFDKLFTIDANMAEQNQLGVLEDNCINEIKASIRSLF